MLSELKSIHLDDFFSPHFRRHTHNHTQYVALLVGSIHWGGWRRSYLSIKWVLVSIYIYIKQQQCMNVDVHVSIVTISVFFSSSFSAAQAHNRLLYVNVCFECQFGSCRGCVLVWWRKNVVVIHQNNSVVISERELLLHVTHTPWLFTGNILFGIFVRNRKKCGKISRKFEAFSLIIWFDGNKIVQNWR